MNGLICTKVEIQSTVLWQIEFGSQCRVEITSPWRIISEGAISLTNLDHRARWGDSEPIDGVEETTKILVNARVKVVGYTTVGDLIIDFEGPHILQVLNLSSLYEAWNLYGFEECHYIGLGGGNVATFLPSPTQHKK